MSLLLRLQSSCTNSIGFKNLYLSPKHPSVDNEVKGRHMTPDRLIILPTWSIDFQKLQVWKEQPGRGHTKYNRVPALFTPSRPFVYVFAIFALFFFFLFPLSMITFHITLSLLTAQMFTSC